MGNKMNKREFLITTTMAIGAICAWEPLVSIGRAATTPPKPRRLKLTGTWSVSEAGKDEWFSATVPGCVHTDLLAAGKIPDPFYRDNENAVQWVGKSNWVYKRAFFVPREVLKNDRVLLRCDGLDTLATIMINGKQVAKTDNMFRLWEFDAKPFLQEGDNEIHVLFESPFPTMDAGESKRAMSEWIGSHEPKGRAYVRKEPCSFGWDWGPNLPSCGIWKNISIETFNKGRITDALILQGFAKDKASLDIAVASEILAASPDSFQIAVSVFFEDKSVASAILPITDGLARGSVDIKDPALWWPAGMGGQPLYTVFIELVDADNNPVDGMQKRIGLRELRMILPANGNPLQFEANGVPYFAKGGNWIPCDSFTSRVTPDILRRYVQDAAAVNMNTLRFWGGGYYEDDALFDACDEAGICIWLDCKFACSSQPAFDDAFMDNVKHEITDNVRRLRHHPCIAVWCGNNEISLMTKPEWSDHSMGQADYDKLFKGLIAQQVAEMAPQANYVSGSPDCGDTHYWEVWHGPKTFDAYRSLTGFMSEFGFESFPEPKTVRAFTSADDRSSVVSPIMKWHQRSGRGDEEGNQLMLDMINHYFNPPKDFDMTLWLSQILQGFGIKVGAEYWRQTMPKSMGCVFWQYNDIWPGMSWSSVDYFGRWKALHYMARKFYAPILVSALENNANSSADIFVTSDAMEPTRAKLSWTVTDLSGKTVAHDSMHLNIAPRKSEKVKTLNLQKEVQRHGADGILTWLTLEAHGEVISENLVLLALPKELRLTNPGMEFAARESEDGFSVTLKSKGPALWTWLELEDSDAKYSDNFVHVTPGTPRQIDVQPASQLNKEDFLRQLRVRSLWDTYND